MPFLPCSTRRRPSTWSGGPRTRRRWWAIAFRDGEEYILRRIIGSQGRSRAFVNDRPGHGEKAGRAGGPAHPCVRPERVAAASQQGELRRHYRPVSRARRRRQELAGRVRRLDEVSRDLEAKRKAAAEAGKGDRAARVPAPTRSRGSTSGRRGRADQGEAQGAQGRGEDKGRHGGRREGALRRRAVGLCDLARALGAPQAVFRASSGSRRSRKGWRASPSTWRTWSHRSGRRQKSLDYEPGELEALEDRLAAILRLKEKYGKTYGRHKGVRGPGAKRGSMSLST